MGIDVSADGVVKTWRQAIKSKERRIFRLEERVEIRLGAIQKRLFTSCKPLDEWLIRQAYYRDIGTYEFIDADWRPIRVGETWGGPNVSAFFRRRIQIPPEMAGQPVTLRCYIGGDSLLSLNGVPYHGLDPFRNEVLLTDSANPGELFDVEIESYVNWHSGEAVFNTFQLAELVVVDPDIHRAYWDFRAAAKVLAIEKLDPRLKDFLEEHLWDALKQVSIHEPDVAIFKSSLTAAAQQIRDTVYDTDIFQVDGLLHLVGHSHLDLVFMWPYREFIRKVGRTHSTMLRLLEQYPDFKFSQSQAKLYADMKEHYPALYAQVKQRVAEGRWEPIGAFWVEPDCNLISGESFVRQIIYGQRFWETEFGIRSRTCWQPDVFGLSWAMPQILKRSGIDYMMTTKLFVWNDTNPWTHNTFWWEGPDGSRVLGVIPPGHFIGMVDPDHMDMHWHDFSDRKTIGESMYCYGWGDGGGGVDPEMLECAQRYQRFPGMVTTRFSNPEETLDSINRKAQDADLPIWRDELYLEAHRGTYTNKGRLKKLNRQSELLYREAELLAALAWCNGASYPSQRLDVGWKELLTNQFHDSLPGTHIHEVYPQLLASYDKITAIGQEVRDSALSALAQTGEAETPTHLIVFNSFLHPRSDIIRLAANDLDDFVLTNEDQTPLAQQPVVDLNGVPEVLIQMPEIPPVGYRTLNRVVGLPGVPVHSPLKVTDHTLENEFIRATFNRAGEITSLWDIESQREIICPGQVGNRFQLFEDQPGKYDAWDIVATYVEHELEIPDSGHLTIAEPGPLRASLLLEKPLMGSSIKQRISLYAGSRQLVFETVIDWVERQKLLKVAFPVNINTLTATYDIAFGNIKRAAHRNTSYDAARFEVPAHQWMDMSEGNYGIALLNDCKYGHEADGRLMRLTLLKGSIYPDPAGDLETHHFTYSLYPHRGDWRSSHVIHEALNLNNPLLAQVVSSGNRKRIPSTAHSFFHCNADNITLEAAKRSEDGQHLILRFVERHNQHDLVTLTFDRPVRHAWICDLMEDIEEEPVCHGATIAFHIKPYEIVTLRVEFSCENEPRRYG
ncbi:MAG: alpha-mannosidase [Anaerolineales bacterium]|nr:alpha-mannosidase [Anaerolineales bacterium]